MISPIEIISKTSKMIFI